MVCGGGSGAFFVVRAGTFFVGFPICASTTGTAARIAERTSHATRIN
jgi:hypothetical protein